MPFPAKKFLDDDSPFIEDLLRTTAEAAHLPNVQTARELIAVHQPRDPVEAMLAAQVVTSEAELLDEARRAATPGWSNEHFLRHTDAIISLDKKIRATRHTLAKTHAQPWQPAPVPLEVRLKAHFVDGGRTVH